MNSWSNFKTNNNLIVAQSEIPYILEVEGVAILGQNSTITIKGFNFNPGSEVICSAGIISNIKKDPEQISFDCLASSLGSFLVEVRNNSLSSLDWNSNFASILIARNALNLTNGWLDFRTTDSSSLGSVVSHVNQGMGNKNLDNSGYFVDIEKGLCIGNSGVTNSFGNYIQFNNFPFPTESTRLELIMIASTLLTSGLHLERLRVGLGDFDSVNNNFINFETFGNTTIVNRKIKNGIPESRLNIYPINSLLINSTYYLKIIFDFFTRTVAIYKLNSLNDLDSLGSFVIDNIPVSLPEITLPDTVVPLFQYINPNSLSSVVAMKID